MSIVKNPLVQGLMGVSTLSLVLFLSSAHSQAQVIPGSVVTGTDVEVTTDGDSFFLNTGDAFSTGGAFAGYAGFEAGVAVEGATETSNTSLIFGAGTQNASIQTSALSQSSLFGIPIQTAELSAVSLNESSSAAIGPAFSDASGLTQYSAALTTDGDVAVTSVNLSQATATSSDDGAAIAGNSTITVIQGQLGDLTGL